MQKELLRFIEGLTPQLLKDRRDFHRHPEEGWLEIRTASLVARRLNDLGFEIRLGREVLDPEARMGVPAPEVLAAHRQRALDQGADPEFVPALAEGFTAVVGTIRFGTGPGWALRFDMDALPVEEMRDHRHRPFREGFASLNSGVMHACGHDAHTAVGLGVAAVLARLKKTDNPAAAGLGTVHLLFQPAEEGVRGARSLAASGVLDGIDRIVGGHLITRGSSGAVAAGANGFLATTKLDASFKGLAAHAGGTPEAGNNALLAACTATLNLHAVPRHSGGASRVSVGTLEGGTGRNVVPDRSFLRLETRGATTAVNEYMESYARRILQGAADMHGVEVDVVPVGGAPGGICDLSMVERVAGVARELGLFTEVMPLAVEGSGSEDFFALLERVQAAGGAGTYFQIGARPGEKPAEGISYGHHHGSFDLDEGMLAPMVALMVGILFAAP